MAQEDRRELEWNIKELSDKIAQTNPCDERLKWITELRNLRRMRE